MVPAALSVNPLQWLEALVACLLSFLLTLATRNQLPSALRPRLLPVACKLAPAKHQIMDLVLGQQFKEEGPIVRPLLDLVHQLKEEQGLVDLLLEHQLKEEGPKVRPLLDLVHQLKEEQCLVDLLLVHQLKEEGPIVRPLLDLVHQLKEE